MDYFISHTSSASDLSVEQLLGALNDIERKNAPQKLYFRGDQRLLRANPRVAIVGSRKASLAGLKRARKLSRALVGQGAVIVSGLAEGIDTAAHEAAMEAGGRTIAVLGSSLENPYPTSNSRLFERIATEHLVVTQFASDASVQPKNFPIRNRTMALIAHATVIVEAAEKSGTLHQAWEALRLGRPLFIMESVAINPELKWPAEVQRYGAQILSDATFEDLLEQLPAGQFEEAVAF